MRNVGWLAAGVVMLMGGAACSRQPEFQLIGSIHEIMEGAVAPPAEIVWGAISTIVDADGIHEKQPQTDQEWEIVEHAAIALAESGNLLLMEGRTQDGKWVEYAQEMIRTSVMARDAVRDKNAERVIEVGEQIYNACTGCHQSYITGP